MGVEFSYDGSALREELLQNKSFIPTLELSRGVYDYAAIHWFHQIPGALNACWRAVRHGGLLILSFPHNNFDSVYYDERDGGWSIEHAVERVNLVCNETQSTFKFRASGVHDGLPGAFMVLEKVDPFGSNILITPDELAQSPSVGVVRDGHLGDLLILTAVLHEVKLQYPGVRLRVYCDDPYLRVFDGNPDVEPAELTPNTPDGIECDKIVNLRRYVEDGPDAWTTERASIFAHAFGIELQDGRPWYYCGSDPNVELEVDELLADHQIDPVDDNFVIVAPDASDPRRSFSDAVLDAMLERLERLHMKYLVLGTDRGSADFDIERSATVLRRSGSLIAADNGMYHLAEGIITRGALREEIHSQVVFNVVDPALRLRWYRYVTAHIPRVSCAPCNEQPVADCAWQCCSVDAIDVAFIVDAACVAARRP